MSLVITEYEHVDTVTKKVLARSYQKQEMLNRTGSGENEVLIEKNASENFHLYRWSTHSNSWHPVS